MFNTYLIMTASPETRYLRAMVAIDQRRTRRPVEQTLYKFIDNVRILAMH